MPFAEELGRIIAEARATRDHQMLHRAANMIDSAEFDAIDPFVGIGLRAAFNDAFAHVTGGLVA